VYPALQAHAVCAPFADEFVGHALHGALPVVEYVFPVQATTVAAQADPSHAYPVLQAHPVCAPFADAFVGHV
jgi:hypothetical protein